MENYRCIDDTIKKVMKDKTPDQRIDILKEFVLKLNRARFDYEFGEKYYIEYLSEKMLAYYDWEGLR